MTRTTVNFIVDLLSAVVGLGIILTGLIMYFALPPGSRQVALWGLGRHDWGDLHAWLALAVVLLVTVHLALHWGWVCAYVQRTITRNPAAPMPARSTIYGTALLAVMVALLVGFVVLSKAAVAPATGLGRSAEHAGEAVAVPAAGGEHAGERGRQAINGSISLTQAAVMVGTTTADLKQRLVLPADTPDDTRLRVIAESKGLSMAELREKIVQ